MSQHSGSISPLSEHPASPALLTNDGPHGRLCSKDGRRARGGALFSPQRERERGPPPFVPPLPAPGGAGGAGGWSACHSHTHNQPSHAMGGRGPHRARALGGGGGCPCGGLCPTASLAPRPLCVALPLLFDCCSSPLCAPLLPPAGGLWRGSVGVALPPVSRSGVSLFLPHGWLALVCWWASCCGVPSTPLPRGGLRAVTLLHILSAPLLSPPTRAHRTPSSTAPHPPLCEGGLWGLLRAAGPGCGGGPRARLGGREHAQKPVRTAGPGRAGTDSGASEEACLGVVNIHAHSQFENRSRRKASQGLPLVRCFTGHNHVPWLGSARRSPAILRETSEETSY